MYTYCMKEMWDTNLGDYLLRASERGYLYAYHLAEEPLGPDSFYHRFYHC